MKVMKAGVWLLILLLANCVGKNTTATEENNSKITAEESTPKKEPVLSYNKEPEKFTVIKMDTPAIFLMKGGNIETLMEFDRTEGSYLFVDIETSDYLIFRKWNFSGGTYEVIDSVIYRKKDRRFFNFHADGGNGSLLYVINYKTQTFDFFEITDNGAKKDIARVPIPNDSNYWYAIDDEFLVPNYNVLGARKEIYRLNGINVEKLAGYSSFPYLWITGRSGFAIYTEEELYKAKEKIIINLSNMKETRIKASTSFEDRTKESLFLQDGDRLGRYDIQTGVYSLMEGIIANKDSFRYADFFIDGYKEYQINIIYSYKNNQFLFNSDDKICMYDFNTDIFYILFDYNIYPQTEDMGYLYFLNDRYLNTLSLGVSDLVSLDDKKITYRFVMNWIDRSGVIDDISSLRYYETREGDIIIYPVHRTNFGKD